MGHEDTVELFLVFLLVGSVEFFLELDLTTTMDANSSPLELLSLPARFFFLKTALVDLGRFALRCSASFNALELNFTGDFDSSLRDFLTAFCGEASSCSSSDEEDFL
jgi:hypothetical protein